MLPSKRDSTHPILAYYSIYRPRKDKRLSWPSWSTYSGQFTHISGHLSAAGQAQDGESLPGKHGRSSTVLRNQALISIFIFLILINIVSCMFHYYILTD